MARLILLCSAVLGGAMFASSASCPAPDWVQYNNACYWASSTMVPWNNIDEACSAEHPGARPVVIHDRELNAVLAERVMKTDDFAWLPLRRPSDEAAWGWSDGSELNFMAWAHRQPAWDGEACTLFRGFTGTWWAIDCKDTAIFICQADIE